MPNDLQTTTAMFAAHPNHRRIAAYLRRSRVAVVCVRHVVWMWSVNGTTTTVRDLQDTYAGAYSPSTIGHVVTQLHDLSAIARRMDSYRYAPCREVRDWCEGRAA
jgi:hypothetical protein